ncbi:MAG: membrane protein insertion efficiency factor YidD [Deltaproteobacteria bacterium]|nr:membrane protein insertion efficiency factor YidD [Deltaproteobacteria bacterium]
MTNRLTAGLRGAATWAALLLLGVYRLVVSPLLLALAGSRCRFEPSCSEYARQALLAHGPLNGALLALRRLARCRPLGGFGYDPVVPRPPEPGWGK